MEKAKKPRGRPSTLTDKALTKLEVAFKAGMSDTDACATAEVTTRSLYRYQKDHPDFVAKKAQWKRQLLGTAMMVVASDIAAHRDVRTAKWFIEREDAKAGNALARKLAKAQAEKAQAEAELAKMRAKQTDGFITPVTVNVTMPEAGGKTDAGS